jgi:hypothetical protein
VGVVAKTTAAYDLWRKAGGGTSDYDRATYHRLMVEAGLILVSDEPVPKCTDPTHGTCGYFCRTCGDGGDDV